MMKIIPRYDPTYQYRDILQSLRRSSSEDCENELCSRLRELYGVKHVFAFDSARIGLSVLLKAYNRPGRVLMPGYTCIVVPDAVSCAGYKPLFADIDLKTLNVNKESLSRVVTPDTTAVLATHTFGIPCDLDEIEEFARKHDLLLIEDAAPAIGAEFRNRIVGTFGEAAVVSFQATKVISSEGGGALLTNSDVLCDRINSIVRDINSCSCRYSLFLRALARKTVLIPEIYWIGHPAKRLVGPKSQYDVIEAHKYEFDKYIKKCPSFTSALAALQFDRLERNLDRRRALAKIYLAELSGHPHIALPEINPNSNPSWIQFPIMVKNKRRFFGYMQKRGIDASWTYKYSCCDSYDRIACPNTKVAAGSVIGLPTYPSLSDDKAYYICSVARKYSENA